MRIPTVIAAALLVLVPAARAAEAPADSLAYLGQDVAIATTGPSRLVQTLVLASPGPAELRVPFGFDGVRDLAVDGRDVAFPAGDGGEPEPLRTVTGRRLLQLHVGPSALAGDTIVVRCALHGLVDWKGASTGFGGTAVERTFVNDADLSLGTYRLTMRVPAGFQVRRITSSEPAFKPDKSPTPPYAVGRDGDRGIATIQARGLRPGGRVKFAIQAEPIRRGSVPLVGGLLLGALYLWSFRDLVGGRGRAKATITATPRRPS